MHEVILLGISTLALTLLWRLGARKTYLDEARDSLFDLRDKCLRPFFMSRERGLEDPLYIKLRGLINGHIRHTENFSFVSYISLIVLLHNSMDNIETSIREHNKEFSSEDEELQKISDRIRKESAEIMLIYMVKSSLFARTLIFFSICFLVCKRIKQHLGDILDRKNYGNYMKIAAVVALTIIPTRVIPGLPANATQNAIEAHVFEV